jgi:hypothetical protein
LRADSGFWSWKLVDALNRHGVLWSITVTQHQAIRAAIVAIAEGTWVDIDCTLGGKAQVAETDYTDGPALFALLWAAPASLAAKPNCFLIGVTTRSSPTPHSMLSPLMRSIGTTRSSNSRSVT